MSDNFNFKEYPADTAFKSFEPFNLPPAAPVVPPGMTNEADYLFKYPGYFDYRPAAILKWEWSGDWQRWRAFVRFNDGYECCTFPKPEILGR